ncbi:hypothetical protein PV08_03209 [Exophiala spinifera]|uniref:Amidase domain-containing protein n=1 Tax=Exophiala spinifera TaxID=91928 RepID=A0A0D2BK16_9EURO|nr:uncharacterized protein PV08_03209 [Exophiala spinifera]KIW18920.1 hypothetical protein PV08_03209 [Exophiala spinifera]
MPSVQLKLTTTTAHGMVFRSWSKDNTATTDLGITCGSCVFYGATVGRDASYVQKLRKAGVIILGKSNLSEWGNIRSTNPGNFRKSNSSNGWSAVGGQTLGVYYPNQDPIGSSSGSGVATALGLAFAAIGIEVGGSIIGPAQRSNIIGIKPTVGLTSRDLVFISKRQGTVGPMARTLEDAASLLEIIGGKCPHDPETSKIPFEHIPKYARFCNKSALKGARIGIPRNAFRDNDEAAADEIDLAGIAKAASIMKDAGAEIIDPADYPEYETFLNESGALRGRVGFADWKADMARYVTNLVDNPQNINNIDDLVEFTQAHPKEEYPSRDVAGLLGVSKAMAQDVPRVEEAWERVRELAVRGGINGAMKKHNLDALIMPSSVSTSVATVALAPVITVPLGFYPENTGIVWNGRRNLVLQDKNLPFGLSFIGLPFTETKLIGYAYAFEQLTKVRDQVDPIVMPKTELRDVAGKDSGI